MDERELTAMLSPQPEPAVTPEPEPAPEPAMASSPAVESIFCTNCGYEARPGQRFCRSCGARLIEG
jgi:hypothetical protein